MASKLGSAERPPAQPKVPPPKEQSPGTPLPLPTKARLQNLDPTPAECTTSQAFRACSCLLDRYPSASNTVHATFYRAWVFIKDEGIIPGGPESRRSHTHLIPSSSLMRKPHLARKNADILIFFRTADLQHIADVRTPEYSMSTNGYILTKNVLTTDSMLLVYDVRRGRYLKDLRGIGPAPLEIEEAGDCYSDWYHNGHHPDPDYRDEPGPFEAPSSSQLDPSTEELRQNVEELVEKTAHDYADPDLSEDEKESIRQAKGKTKKTLERIKLSKKAQDDTFVCETKILKTFSSDGTPGLSDFTSLIYAALASEVDIVAGDGNRTAKLHGPE